MAQSKAVLKKAKKTPAKKAAAPVKKAAPKPVAPKAKAKPAAKPVSSTPATTKIDPAAAGKPAKPVKVSSGLSKSDMLHFRNLLLEKRREILGDVGSMESEAFKQGSNLSNMPIHMADVGTDNFEQEFTLGLIESERQILREIQEALVRVDDGTFGICQGTGKAIGRVRLEAVPWAKYCMEYAKALESGQIRRENGQSSEDDSSDDDED
jgi:RNA polymerase-binding protein DksA